MSGRSSRFLLSKLAEAEMEPKTKEMILQVLGDSLINSNKHFCTTLLTRGITSKEFPEVWSLITDKVITEEPDMDDRDVYTFVTMILEAGYDDALKWSQLKTLMTESKNVRKMDV